MSILSIKRIDGSSIKTVVENNFITWSKSLALFLWRGLMVIRLTLEIAGESPARQ